MAFFLGRSGLFLCLLLLLPPVIGEYGAYQLALYLLFAVAALGVALPWGQAGLVCLGQGLFFALGAYITGIGLNATSAGVLQWLIPVAAGVGCGILAVMVALAIFRARTDAAQAFSLITLALALCGNQVAGTWSSVTGGFNGLSGIPSLPGLQDLTAQFRLASAFLGASIMVAVWLVKSPLGTLWRAVACNEKRLAFLGYSIGGVKASAFGVGAALAGSAGAVYAQQQALVTPDLAGFTFSGSLLIYAAVGGRRTVLGPVLGAVIVGSLAATLREHISWTDLAIAGFFLVVVLKLPGGLGSLIIPLARLFSFRARRFVEVGAPMRRRAAGPLSLALENVDVHVGEVTVLSRLQLHTGEEKFLCLIGPNGAGKTSTLNVLTGELRKTSGVMKLQGRPISRPTPNGVALRGVARKFQAPSVFPTLSVAENCSIALWAGRAHWWQLLSNSTFGWSSPVMQELRTRFPFLRQGQRLAGELSHGERQMLELAMALLTEPRLLLLDEPCAGLSQGESQVVIDTIRWAQHALDFRVVMIEHDMDLVRRVAERIVVMHQGQVLAAGTAEEIGANEAVRKVYVRSAS